jgi:hypothetical protein
MYAVTTAQLIGIGSVVVAFTGTLVFVIITMIRNGHTSNKEKIEDVDMEMKNRMEACQEAMNQKFEWVKGSINGLYKQTNETNASLVNMRIDMRVIAKILELQDKKLFTKACDRVKKESDDMRKPIVQ